MNSVEVDWGSAKDLVRSFLSKRLRGPARDDLDDLTQLALKKLHLALSKSSFDRIEPMLLTIAYCTLMDYWRRKIPERKRFEPLGPRAAEPVAYGEDPWDRLGDRRSEVRWVVLTYLKKHAPGCYDLALQFFAEDSWVDMGRRAHKKPETLQREWNRCVARMRLSASRNPASALAELKP